MIFIMFQKLLFILRHSCIPLMYSSVKHVGSDNSTLRQHGKYSREQPDRTLTCEVNLGNIGGNIEPVFS